MRPRQFSTVSKHLDRKLRGRYNWGPSSNFAVHDSTFDVGKLKVLSASQLATCRSPPRGVKALVRDFIHDALYNPFYGYFPQRAVIYSASEPLAFTEMRNSSEFDGAVARIYKNISDANYANASTIGAQLWHTPVEIFQPWYGQAIARCLASEYLLRHFPYEDFVVYEMGGGNGTLGLNILDYLRHEYPEIYERTTYKIIEISPGLAKIQQTRLKQHSHVVEVINKSIFDWDDVVDSPCFFLALEVIDNFAHDVVRYDPNSLKAYQGITVTSPQGDYEEVYEPLTDPLIMRYMGYRDEAGHTSATQANSYHLLQQLRNYLPITPNLSKAEFIPTRLVNFLEVLREKFPRHRLLLSDFSSLPNSISSAYTAPVVQTRYKGTMVPCSTYMVQPGYFDIFFPTNFELLRDMYHLIMRPRNRGASVASAGLRLDPNFFSRAWGPSPSPLDLNDLGSSDNRAQIYTHREFLTKYADLSRTEVRSGENPMLDYYANVKVIF